jgi:phage terminase large subunit
MPLLDPARYKGIYGGRGSGKSRFAGSLWAEENIRKKLDVVCLREVQKSLKFSMKKLLGETIERLNVGSYFEVQDQCIKSKRGGITIFEGMQNHTADSIKSLEGFDRAIFEESQSASQYSLDLLRPTIRKPGSELWFIWNPDSKKDPVDKFLRGDTPPDALVVESNFRDNPWFPDVLRIDMEYDRARDIDKYNWIWEGKYQKYGKARVFNNWVVEEFDSPPGGVYRLGADWGFANDPTTLVRARLDGNRLYIDYEAYLVGCEINQTPDLFDLVPNARKWFITADNARPETIAYLRSHGYPKIRPCEKGKGSVADGIEWLKSFEIVVHPRCVHTIDELGNYKWRVDPLTDDILPLLADKHNHVIDALRYACEGARKALKQGGATPVVQGWQPTNSSMGFMG